MWNMSGQKSWAEGRWWRGATRGGYLWFLAIVLLLPFVLHVLFMSQKAAPPLQQFYIQAYRTSCSVVRRSRVLPYVQRADGTQTLASISDVVVLPPKAAGALRVALTEQAIRSGVTRVEFLRTTEGRLGATCAALERQIQSNAHNIRTRIPQNMLAVLTLGVIALAVSVSRSRSSRRAKLRGHALRGPELVTREAFNHSKRANGIGFFTDDGRGVLGRLLRGSGRAALSIRSQEESSHFLLMGDTGTGKSSLIRQLLEQIADRDEAAIVYDPALEFTPQFYKPERGDQILNPLDTRMPFWSPGDEILHRSEAVAFAKALFPDDRHDNRFFVESPRKIFAHLLSFKPTAQEIAHWLKNQTQIDRLLNGTELASMVDHAAPSQRAGVLASLSMVGDSFQLIPDKASTAGEWSACDWARHRKGWLFLTSTPQTLDRLRPLISLWLDLLLVRLLSGGPPVWVFLDELPTLNKLPKLPEALALARKPNVRLVLGLQGRAQLETRYGPESEAMLSQPATKVFLRTSEPRAAEWVSKALGEIEFERLRESVNYSRFLKVLYDRKGHGFSLERQTKPLVLPSEISGLSNLTGYLKSENYVVKFAFKPNPVRNHQPALSLRSISPNDWPQRPTSDTSSTSGDQGDHPAPSSGERAHRLKPQRRPDVPQRSHPAPAVERDVYFE
jgi:type IV secretory pathway TraG/TraD family ATPase VirD4